MTKRVKMLAHIGGWRDGVEWPNVGEECDLPDHEAEWMADAGHVEIVGEAKKGKTSATESTVQDAVAEPESNAVAEPESNATADPEPQEEAPQQQKRRARK